MRNNKTCNDQMKKIIILIMLVSSTAVFSQNKAEKEVIAGVEALRLAMINPDKEVLGNLVSDELSYGHSSGNIEDKASFIETLVSGKSNFVDITLSEQTIQIVDNTALVRHNLLATTHDTGKAPGNVNLGILLVWVKQKSEWKLIARQAFKR